MLNLRQMDALAVSVVVVVLVPVAEGLELLEQSISQVAMVPTLAAMAAAAAALVQQEMALLQLAQPAVLEAHRMEGQVVMAVPRRFLVLFRAAAVGPAAVLAAQEVWAKSD
jgi:hypothetical protein